MTRSPLYRRLQRLPAPALLALLYLVLVATGFVVLQLPVSHNDAVGWSEALFTATSAVTVTGLTVVDTGRDFTLFGQIVIAVLIQLGGIGLMTFAMLLLSALGIPIGMPQRMVVRQELNQSSLSNLAILVRRIAITALVVETLGAVALLTVFVPEFGWTAGLWHAIFHSVSAFNNAGFALFSDSLSGWVTDPVINTVIPLMIIVSGLGFVVIGDMMQTRQWRRFSLHTKLMLTGTLALIVWATGTFAVLEWTNPATLGGLDTVGGKLTASWFQGVTPRTAGFNTIDTTAMRDETAFMTIALMLIGGGSTSTAGGIKVTTFIVLLLATVAFFRRREELHAFGRSIGTEEVMKVLALTMISILLIMVTLFLLMILEDNDFMHLSFEIVSAFGTVGLTMGATGDLSTAGRFIVIFVMFVGRVGPLTLGFFLATRSRPRVRYPDGQVYLG
ncbi:TrkH family potassium uptake protein [Roseovarius sp. SCSIO 43702]|uniref:TrkH family potassium uptake protein n=1 Tax=Roseovarius sp. SCSIO 43702 TaxID=2823043 RepID=UPI001C735F06|nr:TrkH family potassium uptake protein [Roseovarius sp. SCSIO 43702]QYX56066.1 TrkH family potassium uptake protein [Roseovarius sp. SCSIO 43702]